MQWRSQSNGEVSKLSNSHRQGSRWVTRRDIAGLLMKQSGIDSMTELWEQGRDITERWIQKRKLDLSDDQLCREKIFKVTLVTSWYIFYHFEFWILVYSQTMILKPGYYWIFMWVFLEFGQSKFRSRNFSG